MTSSEYFTKQARNILLGDRKIHGLFRFAILVLLPCVPLLLELKWKIMGPSLTYYLQLLVIYYLGLLNAIADAVAYIKDIYGLDSDRMPFRHFVSSFFGLQVPKIQISNQLHDSDWKELVETIGGPAILDVKPGYAVLTETLTAPANRYGQGDGHFLSRQERIHEIIDLSEQEGTALEVKATTRDGITVIVEKVKYDYRLWDALWEADPAAQNDSLNPYPFSEEAIHNLVYSRTVAVDENGNPKEFNWMGAVGGKIQGILKDYISERRLDDVIATHEHLKENPRKEIQDKAYQPDFKKTLRSMGTILRWWDPGEFKSLETIEGQFLSNWSVDIKSNIQINQAYGEAQKQAYAELGRAEAEAELLMSIIHSLDGIRFGADKTQTLQNLILMRTAQVIRALNASSQDEQAHRPDKPKPNNVNA